MKMHGWGVGTMASVGVLAAWFVACAGEDIPTVDEDLRADISTVYPDEDGTGGQQGQAGAAATPPGDGAAGSSSPSDGGAAGAGGDQGAALSGRGGTPVASAGSGPTGGGGGGADVCDAYNTILVPRCGTAGCHNAGSSQGAFAVEGDETAIDDFIDKPSTRGCSESFINTSDIDRSLIYTRTTEDFPQECGILQMPLQGDFLTPEQTTCLQDWLSQFAN